MTNKFSKGHLQKTAIIDKNGKATHVHKSDGITSAAGFRAPLKPTIAAELEMSMADSLDAIIAEGYDEPVGVEAQPPANHILPTAYTQAEVLNAAKLFDNNGFNLKSGKHVISGDYRDDEGRNKKGWDRERTSQRTTARYTAMQVGELALNAKADNAKRTADEAAARKIEQQTAATENWESNGRHLETGLRFDSQGWMAGGAPDLALILNSLESEDFKKSDVVFGGFSPYMSIENSFALAKQGISPNDLPSFDDGAEVTLMRDKWDWLLANEFIAKSGRRYTVTDSGSRLGYALRVGRTYLDFQSLESEGVLIDSSLMSELIAKPRSEFVTIPREEAATAWYAKRYGARWDSEQQGYLVAHEWVEPIKARISIP